MKPVWVNILFADAVREKPDGLVVGLDTLIYVRGRIGRVVFHQTTSTQYHKATDAPGGIDYALIQYIQRRPEIVAYHLYYKDTNALHALPAKVLLSNFDQHLRSTLIKKTGQFRQNRAFLPRRLWKIVFGLPYEKPSSPHEESVICLTEGGEEVLVVGGRPQVPPPAEEPPLRIEDFL